MANEIQNKSELDDFHRVEDPWGYDSNPEDLKRKALLLSEIPSRNYQNVLDVGCGQGFVTRDLPGESVTGIDISSEAIKHARKQISDERIQFLQASLFEPDNVPDKDYDLIIITGVLYPQYIGDASRLVYDIVDNWLIENGILVCVHINDWYCARFPYLLMNGLTYNYRDYQHLMEIYVK